jgi:RNA polymerase sigma factor (sigma-70 family)
MSAPADDGDCALLYRNALDQHLATIRRCQMLKPEEERELFRRWRDGGDRTAHDRIVTSHMPLVLKIARDCNGHRLPLSDLISEGHVGLLRAVETYDPANEKGARLATYAARSIRWAIWGHVRSAVKGRADLSLDSPTYDDEDSDELRDEVADRYIDGVLRERQDDALADAQQLAALNGAIGVLDPGRERRVFEARWLTEVTLDALAAKEGLSREGARQIELRAFKKVKQEVLRRVDGFSDRDIKSIARHEFGKRPGRSGPLPKAETLARQAVDAMRIFERAAA